jgi:transcriptional regulator with XRE-family HTH domain
MSDLNTNRLRLARERKGLNQIELSKALGVSAGLAGQWERGLKEPSLAKLKDLARELEVTVGWLLGMDEQAAHSAAAAEVLSQPGRVPRDSVKGILSDYDAPIGLRDFAQNTQLVSALAVRPEEWSALASLDCEDLSAHGYCGLLMLLRTAKARVTASTVGRPIRDASVTDTRHGEAEGVPSSQKDAERKG